MLKKTLLTTLFCLLAAGLGGGYFFHAGNYARACEAQQKCTSINIRIMDSLENQLIDCRDVMGFLSQGKGIIGQTTSDIRLCDIEDRLLQRGEVLSAEVFLNSESQVGIDITQRHAKMRLSSGGLDFYCDSTGYLFPVEKNIDVPVITGNIPLVLNERDMGRRDSQPEAKWVDNALGLCAFIENNWFYHKQIEQIDIAADRDIVLYTRDGRQKFILGDFSDIEDKFSRITLFYKGIAPEKKGYNTVNVKYNNQIICR